MLIVIGSSLKVKPVANIPLLLPKNVPQVLINRESLRHMNFDIELLGDCDVIVNEILMRLEQRRLARLDKAKENDASAESNQHDEVEWADICKEKILLAKIEDAEAESLVFSSEKNRSDESNSESSQDDVGLGIHKEDQMTNESAAHEQQKEENQETPAAAATTTTTTATAITENDLNRVVYTKDYLKEASFVYLKPNIHIFHGAEVSLRFMYKKLRRLRRIYESFVKGEMAELAEDRGKILAEDREDEFADLDSDEDEFSDDYDTEEDDDDDDGDDDGDDDEDDDDKTENGIYPYFTFGIGFEKNFFFQIFKKRYFLAKLLEMSRTFKESF